MPKDIPGMFDGPEYNEWTDEQKYNTMRDCALIGRYGTMKHMCKQFKEQVLDPAEKRIKAEQAFNSKMKGDNNGKSA